MALVPLRPKLDMIDTGEHLKIARHSLGWSLAEMAGALLLADGKSSEDRLRQMEEGRREISGPIKVAVLAYLHGWRAPWMTESETPDD